MPRYVFVVTADRDEGIGLTREAIVEAIIAELPETVTAMEAASDRETGYLLDWEFIGTDLTRKRRDWKGVRA